MSLVENWNEIYSSLYNKDNADKVYEILEGLDSCLIVVDENGTEDRSNINKALDELSQLEEYELAGQVLNDSYKIKKS